MSTYGTDIGPVTFNPANRTFEALVSFREAGEVIRVPCSLRFPLETDANVVMCALIRQAREKRRLARAPLTSRLRNVALSEVAEMASGMLRWNRPYAA